MNINELVYIDDTGYHFSDYATFLAWRKDQYKAIYGADVYLESDSQDGQLIAVQALSDYQTAALGAAVYNSFSPITAQGVGLSRNVKTNGISRRVPTNSTVDVTIIGTSGTLITNGIVEDAVGLKWNLPVTVTIPGPGTITVTATAQDLGAIQAQANTVNKIFTPTRGWQSVNNASAATPGEPIETDAELRARQAISTANPSLTVFDGTIGAVSNVAGVTNIRGYENFTNVTDSNGLPPHSFALIVAGGDATEIAQTILLHKTQGTQTVGTTTELVYDQKGMPYNINFYRPTQVTIKVEVTISINVNYSSSYATAIKESVAAYINSIDIGNDVLITKIYPSAYLPNNPTAAATFDISLIRIGDPSLGTANIDILFNELAVCDATADVTVLVI